MIGRKGFGLVVDLRSASIFDLFREGKVIFFRGIGAAGVQLNPPNSKKTVDGTMGDKHA